MLVPFIRTLILYFLIIIALRFMGKRQVGEMQPSELVITILISAVASVPIQEVGVPLSHGVIPILTLIAAEVIISTASLKSQPFRRMIMGNPVTVIKDGAIDQQSLKRLRFSLDDVLEDLRQKDIFDIRQVKYAQVETNGKLSVLLNPQDSPVTPKLMGITAPQADTFNVLIADGQLSEISLNSLGKSRKWVEKVICANGVKEFRDVFLLCADKHNNIIFIKKES